MRARTRFILLPLLAALTAAPASAQVPTGAQSAAAALDVVMDGIATAWARGDVAGVLGHSDDAISVDFGAYASGPTTSRRAGAVLRRLLAGRETLSIQPEMSELVAGSPAKAYGMLSWRARAEGTTEAELHLVFVAFVSRGGEWRLTQIRLLE